MFRSSSWIYRSAMESCSSSPPASSSSSVLSKSDSNTSFSSAGRSQDGDDISLELMNVTIELKVHVLIFRLSFRPRCIRGSRFELSQFRSHNGLHPGYQFLCLDTGSEAHSYLFPAVLRCDRLTTKESGLSMMVVSRWWSHPNASKSPNPIASTLLQLPVLPPNSDRQP